MKTEKKTCICYSTHQYIFLTDNRTKTKTNNQTDHPQLLKIGPIDPMNLRYFCTLMKTEIKPMSLNSSIHFLADDKTRIMINNHANSSTVI
jgi:hypothetical protein